MNKVLETIHNHRSIRKFKRKNVSKDDLQTVLEAATKASTSGNMQAYSIIVTREGERKEKMIKAHFEQSVFSDAPLFLTFCADFHRMREWIKLRNAANNFDNYMSFMIATIDAVLASQNAALAAESLGLGVCYLGTTLASAKEIGEVLDLPEHVIPVVGFALGHPDEKPEERKRLPLEAIVHEEKYTHVSKSKLGDFYQEKEVLGIKRYLKNKAMAERIKSHPEINLAQIYTEIKYTEESHQKYSMDLLNYLSEQKFLVKELKHFSPKAEEKT